MSLFPRESPPHWTVRQRAGQHPPLSGIKMASEWRLTRMTRAPTGCCCLADPCSSCALCTVAEVNLMKEAMFALQETILVKQWVEMHLLKWHVSEHNEPHKWHIYFDLFVVSFVPMDAQYLKNKIINRLHNFTLFSLEKARQNNTNPGCCSKCI